MHHSIPHHKDPIFNEIEEQISMSHLVTKHYFDENLVEISNDEKTATPINRRPPDQDFWDQRTKTKEFASKF